MSHGKETLCRPISKSIKERGKCTKSNKINGSFGQIAKEKLCEDLIGSTTRRKDRPKSNIL